MPMFTCNVASVDNKEMYREPAWAARRVPTGTRYNVHLRVPQSVFTTVVYTLDALKASLCLQAKETGQLITVATRDTTWGQEIVTVELATAQTGDAA